MRADPKRNESSQASVFLRSARIKALRKMLLKTTPGRSGVIEDV